MGYLSQRMGWRTVMVVGAANPFIASSSNSRVRKVTAATGIITMVEGTGVAGFSGEGEDRAAAVKTTLGFLGEKIQQNDSVYIFIAGHGFLTPRGLGYFVPSDGTLSNVYASGVSFGELKNLVEENLAHTKVRILMTDVCHAGRIGPEVTQPADQNQNRVNEYLSLIAPRTGTFLNLLASQPNEYSFESEMLGQGVFTHAIL